MKNKENTIKQRTNISYNENDKKSKPRIASTINDTYQMMGDNHMHMDIIKFEFVTSRHSCGGIHTSFSSTVYFF